MSTGRRVWHPAVVGLVLLALCVAQCLAMVPWDTYRQQLADSQKQFIQKFTRCGCKWKSLPKDINKVMDPQEQVTQLALSYGERLLHEVVDAMVADCQCTKGQEILQGRVVPITGGSALVSQQTVDAMLSRAQAKSDSVFDACCAQAVTTRYFAYYSKSTTWDGASYDAQTQSGVLATIDSRGASMLATTVIPKGAAGYRSIDNGMWVWIGLRWSPSEFRYKWPDDTPLGQFNNFGLGDEHETGADCVALNIDSGVTRGLWKGFPCNTQMQSLLEVPPPKASGVSDDLKTATTVVCILFGVFLAGVAVVILRRNCKSKPEDKYRQRRRAPRAQGSHTTTRRSRRNDEEMSGVVTQGAHIPQPGTGGSEAENALSNVSTPRRRNKKKKKRTRAGVRQEASMEEGDHSDHVSVDLSPRAIPMDDDEDGAPPNEGLLDCNSLELQFEESGRHSD